ncbi:mCG60235, partial [Mus musculus]
ALDTCLLPSHTAKTEDVTQGPASCVTSLQQKVPECVSMWWTGLVIQGDDLSMEIRGQLMDFWPLAAGKVGLK